MSRIDLATRGVCKGANGFLVTGTFNQFIFLPTQTVRKKGGGGGDAATGGDSLADMAGNCSARASLTKNFLPSVT